MTYCDCGSILKCNECGCSCRQDPTYNCADCTKSLCKDCNIKCVLCKKIFCDNHTKKCCCCGLVVCVNHKISVEDYIPMRCGDGDEWYIVEPNESKVYKIADLADYIKSGISISSDGHYSNKDLAVTHETSMFVLSYEFTEKCYLLPPEDFDYGNDGLIYVFVNEKFIEYINAARMSLVDSEEDV